MVLHSTHLTYVHVSIKLKFTKLIECGYSNYHYRSSVCVKILFTDSGTMCRCVCSCQELGSMKNHQTLACYNITIQIHFRILFTYCSHMLFVDCNDKINCLLFIHSTSSSYANILDNNVIMSYWYLPNCICTLLWHINRWIGATYTKRNSRTSYGHENYIPVIDLLLLCNK